MPRVHHVKKARKPNPVVTKEDIDQHTDENKLASYYHWKFRYGAKRYSKTYPKPSQLTQSEYLGQFYDLEERFQELEWENREDLVGQIEDIKSEVDDLGQEQYERKENMPEGLQEGDTGQLLEDRANACQQMVDDLDNVIGELESLEDGADDEALQDVLSGIEFCAE